MPLTTWGHTDHNAAMKQSRQHYTSSPMRYMSTQSNRRFSAEVTERTPQQLISFAKIDTTAYSVWTKGGEKDTTTKPACLLNVEGYNEATHEQSDIHCAP